jgi:integrase/recombinase XerD
VGAADWSGVTQVDGLPALAIFWPAALSVSCREGRFFAFLEFRSIRMANLYRKPVLVTDPQTGQKVKTQSKKWWGQFKDAHGRLRRHPLAVDKMAAQAMLNEFVRQVEREKAGLVDPTDRERKRPLAEHLADFRRYKENRDIGAKQIAEVLRQLERIFKICKWRTLADLTAKSLLDFLGDLRKDKPDGERGASAQTYNHYLRAAKQFTRWLVRDRRLTTDPLIHLSNINTMADRRHDRRALTHEEFSRLLEAARTGKAIEGISGSDRAMLYVLAGWTGFRKGELGSLTMLSFRLDTSPPTVMVSAGYSKRRRQDVQILHADVVRQLREWLAGKARLRSNELLFPISERAGGLERDTANMIRRDLARARKLWLDEAQTDEDRKQRVESDFLCFECRDGKFADFHSLRHFFITNLERAGVSPKLAQTLARHSDIRLTLGLYTHIGLSDQIAAIAALPTPQEREGVTKVKETPGLRAVG